MDIRITTERLTLIGGLDGFYATHAEELPIRTKYQLPDNIIVVMNDAKFCQPGIEKRFRFNHVSKERYDPEAIYFSNDLPTLELRLYLD